MNEKKFIRDTIANEHGTRAQNMSADEVLDKRTSDAVVRSRGFAVPAVLAALGLTALTAGGVLLFGGDRLPSSDEAEDIRATTTTTVTSAPLDPNLITDDKTEVKDPKVTIAPELNAPDFTTTTVTLPMRTTVPKETVRGDWDPAQKILPTLSDYPTHETYTYTAPSVGKVELSTPLSEALGEYGGKVQYHLIAEVYNSDGRQIKQLSELQNIASRLHQSGVTAGIEMLGKDEEYNYLLIVAQNEELIDFPRLEEYGLLLRFHGECGKVAPVDDPKEPVYANWNADGSNSAVTEIKPDSIVKLDLLPGFVFVRDGDCMSVTENGNLKSTFSVVRSAYFCDLNGDGYPEVCVNEIFEDRYARYSFVSTYDCKTGLFSRLGGEGVFLHKIEAYDYYLVNDNGRLLAEQAVCTGALDHKYPVRGTLAIRDGELVFEPVNS